MEAIILAGGLGTRLRSVLGSVPKPMVSVLGKPFLSWVLDYLSKQAFTRVVLSVGYRHEQIVSWFGGRYGSVELVYAIEGEPLGTGGAVRFALSRTQSANVFVLNGDSFLALSYREMYDQHVAAHVELSVAVTEVSDTARYGRVILDRGHISGFAEKKEGGVGLINAGVYCMSRDLLKEPSWPKSFSFENDFLYPVVSQLRPLGFVTQAFFVDIGIPEDLERARSGLAQLFGQTP